MTSSNTLDKILSDSERLGVIGSPSSTSELSLDILGAAATRKLVGELALFQYRQDTKSHYALGQITGVELRNVWHEDPTMRSLIRQRGRVDAVSERQDTHLAQMTISAVFADTGESGYEPSILGTVPSTGTNINLVSDEVLDELLKPYRDQLFYLGHVYGSQPKLPMWFKHFGTGPKGAGEAYHLGIFGKTGSGKSVLAKMMLSAYARHREMGILVIDPQGEFAKDLSGRIISNGLSLPLPEIIQSRGRRQPEVFTVKGLVLDRWDLFQEIFYESEWLSRLIPTGANRRDACEVLVENLQKRKVTLSSLAQRASFETAFSLLGQESIQKQFYRNDASRNRFASSWGEIDKESFFLSTWMPLAELFREDRENAVKVDALIWKLFDTPGPRPVVVVNLAREQADGLLWNEHIQALVIKRLLDGIQRVAENAYQEGKSLNALVIIDEAHRLAPRGSASSLGEISTVRDTLVDAARTTRKYGLGWLFISQTLSSIDPEILQQLRIMFFGFGLSMGQEYETLRQIAGSSSSALDLYRLFRDPHSSFDVKSRQYSFMTVGPVSPLSFAGTPLFFNAFNTVDEFLTANGLEIQRNMGLVSPPTQQDVPHPVRSTRPALPPSRVTSQVPLLPELGEDNNRDGMSY